MKQTQLFFVIPIVLVLIVPTIAWAHTKAYETGYLYGAEDRGGENHALDQFQASDYTGKDLDHCISGYNDGFNGVIQSGN